MKDSQKKSLINLAIVVVALIAIGTFWTRQSLSSYTAKWRTRGLAPSSNDTLYIPSPVESFILAQTPDLWGQKWGPQNPVKATDIPAVFGASKVYAEVDKFFINKDQWEVGRILSSLANSGHLDILARTMELHKNPAATRPPFEWLTEDCDILYQEYFFRLYQIRPEQRERVLKELTRCDATSPARLWVLSKSLDVFKHPEGQPILNEIKSIATQVELRPYRRWFAEELYKVGILFSHSDQVQSEK